MRIHLLGGKAQERFFDPKALESGDEVWSLNQCWFSWARRFQTRHFNIHTHANLKRYGYKFEIDAQFLQVHPNIKFYSLDAWPELAGRKNVEQFPVDRLISSHRRGSYHSGSFDWLLAYAMDVICGNPRPIGHEIIIHGVSLLIEAGEPISARACLEYWCGVAEGFGISVTITPDCDLFAFYHVVKSNLIYGLDDTPIFEDRTSQSCTCATEADCAGGSAEVHCRMSPPYKVPYFDNADPVKA